MASSKTDEQGGFIMLDALMAIALVAIAGSTIVMIVSNLLQQQGAALDRSVALVMSQSLMRQAMLLGPSQTKLIETSDELYDYVIETKAPESALGSTRESTISASPHSGTGGGSQELEFLSTDGVEVWVP
jgi:hypothetical protein